MIELALLIGMVLFSFGFLLLAYSVIHLLTEKDQADGAKSGEPSQASMSKQTDSAAGYGTARTASV